MRWSFFRTWPSDYLEYVGWGVQRAQGGPGNQAAGEAQEVVGQEWQAMCPNLQTADSLYSKFILLIDWWIDTTFKLIKLQISKKMYYLEIKRRYFGAYLKILPWRLKFKTENMSTVYINILFLQFIVLCT